MAGYEDKIRRVVPYTPGEQPKEKVIKLNTNEFPYPASPKVTEALRSIGGDELRKYPDPEASELVDKWARYNGLKVSQVFPGVGSDDVLSMCFLTFFNSDKPVAFPAVTYSFYDVWCDVYRIPYVRVPMRDGFHVDKNDYLKGDFGGIVIANPNAPTGLALSLSDIEEILKANEDCIVIIDEAYVDFGASSAVGLIDKYENLIVVQTFSKSRALAGMRIGFAMSNEKVIKYLNDVKYSVNSYTMSRAAIAAGCAAIDDISYFEDTVSKLIATRSESFEALARLGFEFDHSQTNFVFARHPEKSGKEIFEELKKRKIFVRRFDIPGIEDYLRITVGTDEEMEALYGALEEILS